MDFMPDEGLTLGESTWCQSFIQALVNVRAMYPVFRMDVVLIERLAGAKFVKLQAFSEHHRFLHTYA